MKPSVTQSIGNKTHAITKRMSRLDILNKNPDYEYAFRLRKELEEGGGVDQYGYECVGHGNENGERWALPIGAPKSKGKKQMILQDVVLCRRKKEVGAYFRVQENQKYNSQKMLIKTIAQRAQVRLREADPNARASMDISGIDFTQRVGPEETVSGG